MSNNILYGLVSGSYVDLNANLGSFTTYTLTNYQNQLIITGSSSTGNSGTYSVQQSVYIGVCASGKCSFFETFTISSNPNPSANILFKVSPQMSKIHYQYYTGSTLTVVLKQIDFAKKTVKAVTFKSQTQYLSTTAGIASFTQANYFLGDNYLVVRSSTAEEAYQFMSGNLIYLRTRTLSSSEANCYRTFIDAYFSDSLIVLDLYDNGDPSNRGYYVYSFAYSNLASTIKVVPAAAPSYLSFTPPTYTAVLASPSTFSWVFVNSAASSSIAVYRHDDSVSPAHYVTQTISSLGSSCTVVAASKNCVIATNANAYTLYDVTASVVPTVITTQVGNSPTTLQITDDCSKFRVDNKVYAKVNSNYQSVGGTFSSLVALDQTFTYVLADGVIWKYSASINAYQSYYSVNSAFTAGTVLQSYSNSLIAYKLGSSVLINAFIDNGSSLSLLPSIQLAGYSTTPKIAVSPQLSMIAVYGANSNSSASTNLYHADFSAKTVETVAFPSEAVLDPSNMFVSLEETWLYVRQLASPLQTTPGNNKEFAYSIQYSSILTLAKSRKISTSDEAKWVATHTATASNKNLEVYTQFTQTAESGNAPIVV